MELFIAITVPPFPIKEYGVQSYLGATAMWIQHGCTFIIVLYTFFMGQQAAKLAEHSVTWASQNEESGKFRETGKDAIKDQDATEEGRRKSKDETRQQISDAIAQSSRLLVALKTEVDMNIKTKEADEEFSTYVMFLRTSLSRILGFKIALLKFLAIGTDKVDEPVLINSTKTTHSSEMLPQKVNKSNEESSKITKAHQILSKPISKLTTTVKHATKINNQQKDILKNWLKPHNKTDSNCDVVILVKKCELKPNEECVVKTCNDNQTICKSTPTTVCKTVTKKVCRYVPVNKNCHP